MDAPFDSPVDFPAALRRFGQRPLITCHDDADGLSSGAILIRTLRHAGLTPEVRIVGRGENAYSDAFQEEIRRRKPEGVIIADLGVSSRLNVGDIPAIIVDHHAPTGRPEGALVVSGFLDRPIPTSSLLAYRCAQATGAADGLLWLAALGIIGDLAEEAGFAEMAEARAAYGVTRLRDLAALVNAPRRSASGDARPALDLLLSADSPRAALDSPQLAPLRTARAEVAEALAAARRTAPKIVGEVALLLFSSPCQVHPLIAQQWRSRLKDRIVIAANSDFRPAFVTFAARTALDRDLIAFFAEHRPPGADEQYGNGHRGASGGALRYADWNVFVRSLGFGPATEMPRAAA